MLDLILKSTKTVPLAVKGKVLIPLRHSSSKPISK